MLASSVVKEPIGIGTRPSGRKESDSPNVGEIKSLQYGRGVAALLVCLFHYEGVMNQIQTGSGSLESSGFDFIFRAGHSGVEFFFHPAEFEVIAPQNGSTIFFVPSS
jgi:hypothetical protein